MKSWKSSSLPLCGVAVISRKWRVSSPEQLPEPVALGVLDLARRRRWPTSCGLRRRRSGPSRSARSFAWTSSLRLSLSRRQMTRSFSANQLPVRALRACRWSGSRTGDRIADTSSSCHCSTRLPGQTIRQRCRSPRSISSLMKQPGHDRLAGAGVIGQQEPQRLARQHLLVDGGDLVRQRIDIEVWTASSGSKRWARLIRCASETRRSRSPGASKLHARPRAPQCQWSIRHRDK